MPAAAQISGHSATSTPSFDSPGGSLGTSNSENAKQAPQQQPPALPGASRSPAGAAPASKPPTDMSPNDALFDAINRGDIDVARDAITRGADLDARNLLGMTPMELSVDLGRNDISFMLLSYRGSGNGSQNPPRSAGLGPETGGKTAAGKTGKQAHAAKQAPNQASGTVAAPRTPRLFAGDGGTPSPTAGFLGFDAGRTQR
jgi:ankyrin repeat protein